MTHSDFPYNCLRWLQGPTRFIKICDMSFDTTNLRATGPIYLPLCFITNTLTLPRLDKAMTQHEYNFIGNNDVQDQNVKC